MQMQMMQMPNLLLKSLKALLLTVTSWFRSIPVAIIVTDHFIGTCQGVALIARECDHCAKHCGEGPIDVPIAGTPGVYTLHLCHTHAQKRHYHHMQNLFC